MSVLSRRKFLAATGVGTATLMTGLGTQLALAQTPGSGDKLVVLFLSGGADGLSMAPPHGYGSYYDLRPTTAIPEPGRNGGALPLTSASSNGNAVFPTGLDGVVGLHPALAPIHSALWSQGRLAVIVGSGMDGVPLSHFAATRYVQDGAPKGGRAGIGWLGRVADAVGGDGLVTSAHSDGADRLVGGSFNRANLIDHLGDFGLSNFRDEDQVQAALTRFYRGTDSVSALGAQTVRVVDAASGIDGALRPGYPDNRYGTAFSELATILESGLGVQAAAIRGRGWDHHSGLADGFNDNATEMAGGIRAFIDDTGLQGITLLVITEFGRTLKENGSRGTDHGNAYTALAMGAGIRGGVFGDDYPEALSGRSLPIHTDYRKIVSEILSERVGVGDLRAIFPDYTQNGYLGLAR